MFNTYCFHNAFMIAFAGTDLDDQMLDAASEFYQKARATMNATTALKLTREFIAG